MLKETNGSSHYGVKNYNERSEDSKVYMYRQINVKEPVDTSKVDLRVLYIYI